MISCAGFVVESARSYVFFFINDTATTEIYTLSLHDALPIFVVQHGERLEGRHGGRADGRQLRVVGRSEEHTSELQSQSNLVCRLLLEKKKTQCSTAQFASASRPSSIF